MPIRLIIVRPYRENLHERKKSDITAFLKNYAKALSDDDLKTIVAAWHTPSLVVSPEGVIAVSKSAEVETFKASIADYNKKGISGAKLHSADITIISKSVATAAVTWTHIAPDGRTGRPGTCFLRLEQVRTIGQPRH
jgi:hypothetical protein